MKEIDRAIKEIIADEFVSHKSCKTALAALKTMKWIEDIPERKLFKMDIMDKFNSYLNREVIND